MSATPSPFLPWLGVFETLQVKKGHPLFPEAHAAALSRSAQALGLEVGVDFLAIAPPAKTGRWRWIVTPERSYDHFTEENPPQKEAFSLAVAAQRVGSENWDARHKTLSYLTHWQARQEAVKAGADEALLLNERGELASGAMTNLFWVSGGKLRTPDLDVGCRQGVVREWVMAHAPVEAGCHPLALLDEAKEIFLTNSLIGIKPVTKFGGRHYPVGPVTGRLLREYRAAIKVT